MDTIEAMKTITNSIKEDVGYAWSWHCNIVMAFRDAGGDKAIADKGAALFMERCFGVRTDTFEDVRELFIKGSRNTKDK